ncbi:uncharacterized protein BKA55DRAFT_543674 [Fusarium redolens]|uniref:Uncharacterized protein n=1 Tax=Fusarium redolens TaxID=48865 RepID=A0A9P9GE02_FUSRE|nr:uncharacterized protein BKA55DRAFT_543674 [Fusarium redolens]KAH7237038.1 hypothetical protein BKA55DRAFT_543674 [Fusarium redolens]
MRPVDSEEISDLLKWQPLMLFDRTLFGPAYVEGVVSRSPELIASQRGKRLPLELWNMIIDFANRCPEDHWYSLIRPKLLQTSVRGDELVCSKYQRWSLFGNIQQFNEIELYRFYLSHPDQLSHPGMDSSCPNPFGDPLTREFGSPCAFPTALLASKTTFLHVELTVPDIIKHLEDGDCAFCSGRHVTGYGDNSPFETRFARVSQWLGGRVPFVTGPVICPLCVGMDHAWDSINIQTQRMKPMSVGESRSWVDKRLESLGFRKITVVKFPK